MCLWPGADLSYTDDYTANALPNRYYTGLPGGQVIQPTLSPIATSYQPRVRHSSPQMYPTQSSAGIIIHYLRHYQSQARDAPSC